MSKNQLSPKYRVYLNNLFSPDKWNFSPGKWSYPLKLSAGVRLNWTQFEVSFVNFAQSFICDARNSSKCFLKVMTYLTLGVVNNWSMVTKLDNEFCVVLFQVWLMFRLLRVFVCVKRLRISAGKDSWGKILNLSWY